MSLLMGLLLGPFTLLGLLVAVLMWRFKRQPGVDTSNWFNPLRVVWFSLTRPDLLLGVFPWLCQDEWELMQRTFPPDVFDAGLAGDEPITDLSEERMDNLRQAGSPEGPDCNACAFCHPIGAFRTKTCFNQSLSGGPIDTCERMRNVGAPCGPEGVGFSERHPDVFDAIIADLRADLPPQPTGES